MTGAEEEARAQALLEARRREALERKLQIEREQIRRVEEQRRAEAAEIAAAEAAGSESPKPGQEAAASPQRSDAETHGEKAGREAADEKAAGEKKDAGAAAARGDDASLDASTPPSDSARSASPAPSEAPHSRAAQDDDGGERGDDERASPGRGKKGRGASQRPGSRRTEARRSRTRLSLNNALDEDGDRRRSIASYHRQKQKERRRAADQNAAKISRDVVIPDAISVQELSNRMAERSANVIKFLMLQGQMMRINDVLDGDTAQLIVEEFGHRPQRVSETDVEESIVDVVDRPEDLKPRAPIVTVMGHVDHGKTSLLDAIRRSDAAAREAGGITQHIGAYRVVAKDGRSLTFIDTPGHEAFSAMRARGSRVTDIVALTVAADGGVMPQTREAINHARAAGVPIVVVINKIDAPGADPQAVRLALQREDLHVESLGGETLEVEVSALQGRNIDALIEAILLQAELLELKANPDRPAQGAVIESKIERGRGVVASLLVASGSLRVGDHCVAGTSWGRVRALHDENQRALDAAAPSFPVEILGLSEPPEAGDAFFVVENDARAREIVEDRKRRLRNQRFAAGAGTATLEQVFNRLKESGGKEFPLVVKADYHGSLEAVRNVLETLGNAEITPVLLHSGVGEVTESDVSLAAASQAPIIAFSVGANRSAQQAARLKGVEIRRHAIIYELIDDVRSVMEGMLDPIRNETDIGVAEVLDIFAISKIGAVAGCRVLEGQMRGGAHARLRRDGDVVYEGKLSSLKRFKQDVRSVPSGQECGVALDDFQDIRSGDRIECFDVETLRANL